jgi:hypothetical protein
MLKRIMAVLALLVLGLVANTSPAVAAAPITAKTVYYGCQDNVTNEKGRVCLYDWIDTNYASGFFQRSYVTIGNSTDGGYSQCMDLGNKNWHDRTTGSVNNEASSLIVAGITYPSNGMRVTFYDRANCVVNSSTDYYFTIILSNNYPQWPAVRRIPNLADLGTTCDLGNCNLNWANRIGSISTSNN